MGRVKNKNYFYYSALRIIITLVDLILELLFYSVFIVAVPPEGHWILRDEGEQKSDLTDVQ
jgi:hypothetical protein